MTIKDIVTQEFLHEIFEYKDGELLWKKSIGGKGAVTIGKSAGSLFKDQNRVKIRLVINGKIKTFLRYTLIWVYHYGKYPTFEIDHIDQNSTNDRIENLRDVPPHINMINIGNTKANTTGVKGICKTCGDKFLVRIKCKSSAQNINLYKGRDFIEAVLTRLYAEEVYEHDIIFKESPAYLYAKEYIFK